MSEGQAMPSPPAVRAQLLATEHWSLLATRSTAQSEVLSRITTFLMLVSSSIVGLALIGQVTRFDGRFIALALVLLGMLVVIGALTQMRVGNAAIEDLGHVIGMNRLRAAYLELDPAIERFLVTSGHDDDKGVWQTYNHLVGPRVILQPLAKGNPLRGRSGLWSKLCNERIRRVSQPFQSEVAPDRAADQRSGFPISQW